MCSDHVSVFSIFMSHIWEEIDTTINENPAASKTSELHASVLLDSSHGDGHLFSE